MDPAIFVALIYPACGLKSVNIATVNIELGQ